MLALACEMQEQEVGDATNLTVSFSGELLKLSEELLRSGLHVSEVVAGYKEAFDKTMEILPTLTCFTVQVSPDLLSALPASKKETANDSARA